MKTAAVSCESDCKRVQGLMRLFFGRVKFVNAGENPLSGVAMPDGTEPDFGFGDGPGAPSSWIDVSGMTDEQAILTIEKAAGLEAPMRGLGDLVAMMTTAVGIKPCAGCVKRQAALNRMFPSKSYKNTLASAANADKVGEKVRP